MLRRHQQADLLLWDEPPEASQRLRHSVQQDHMRLRVRNIFGTYLIFTFLQR